MGRVKEVFCEIHFYIRDPLSSTFSRIFNGFSIKLIAFIEIKESFFIIKVINKILEEKKAEESKVDWNKQIENAMLKLTAVLTLWLLIDKIDQTQ